MSVKRWRCSQCGKLVPESEHVEHPSAKIAKLNDSMSRSKLGRQLRMPHHRVMRYQGAGRGRIGMRSWMDTCGPIVVEEIDDYVDQLEHFLGINASARAKATK